MGVCKPYKYRGKRGFVQLLSKCLHAKNAEILVSFRTFVQKLSIMQAITYELEGEYIELIRLLKLLRLASTGGHAKLIVEEGEVYLNGVQEFRKRAKVRVGDQLQLGDIMVSVTAVKS